VSLFVVDASVAAKWFLPAAGETFTDEALAATHDTFEQFKQVLIVLNQIVTVDFPPVRLDVIQRVADRHPSF
jgi:hypothetical protein